MAHFENLAAITARFLTLSRRKSLLHRNQFIDLQCKPMDWFLYHKDLRHERVNVSHTILWILYVMRRDKTWDNYLESNHLFQFLKLPRSCI